MTFQCPHIHINSLLWKLEPDHPQLPLDATTLLKTPRRTQVMNLPPGKYYLLGVQASIIRAIKQSCRSIANLGKLQLLIGVDGTPSTSSVSQEMWPILGLLKHTGNNDAEPFVIGFYIAPTKPYSANDFLTPFD